MIFRITNLDHIMPNPQIMPIFWGHDYVANPKTATSLQQLFSDLVTGPFMNGLTQYGIMRGTAVTPRIIDDNNPPKTLTWQDSNGNLVDEITPQLTKWIQAGQVTPPPSPNDINQFYFIIPPPETGLLTYNGSGDPKGNGIQGWHNEGRTLPFVASYYWAIVKPAGDVTKGQTFANGLASIIGHELVEQLADRNGLFKEIGDPCQNNKQGNFTPNFNYRGWNVEQYWSDWDNGCIHGDNPVSMKKFLKATGFNFNSFNGLRSLGISPINIGYVASTMQTH